MSSMVRYTLIAAAFASTALAAPALAQEEPGRADLVATQPSGAIAYAISRWEQLQASPRFSFEDYAGFLLSYPGFPDEDKLKGYAESRLAEEYVAPERVLTYFAVHPPVTNPGRAARALALLATRPGEAEAAAREAWRGGEMSPTAAATLLAGMGARFAPEDHDARMDALLWQRDAAAAAQQLPYVSPARAAVFAARLAILQGGDGATYDAAATSDPGYLYNRSRELRLEGRPQEAVVLLATRPALTAKPHDATRWIDEHLAVARIATAGTAQQIAVRASEAFASEDEVANGPYELRDDYTSLMWLGGTRALWELGDGNGAAPLFYRYGASAKTPQTRSKGFFWAGHAAAQGGNPTEAARYYEMAAQYPEYFYGLLAQQLGLPEMAVVVGRVAPEKGFAGFTPVGFPVVATPAEADWTWVHAIARQESEFDRHRVSHAGAAGLMQLMPGTAREQAGKLGIAYLSASIMPDTQYNIRLGNGYFQRMMASYGSYPLAVAAYNAGPGHVNKWLRANGDPRTGAVGWLEWIERIPIFETKNYVARVLENAAVYEALYPQQATQRRARPVSEFLR